MRNRIAPIVPLVLGSALGLLMAAGCGGPEFHPVSGTVTLDDEPLADANVTFRPASEEGQWGIADTDVQGRYTIISDEKTGLPEGQYEVAISTYVDGNDQPDPPIPAVPERVPMRYNARTTLEFEVKPGENTADFELSSDGQIYNPESFE